ncbi:DUF1294 domain-containing protein [Alysiella crassa]|uniref:Protein of uncharacterized function (DUF1294) n=1 Tax=Alysiella crassa TaxID=153491 RepID=A0A376BVD3_9NEIS|nr:cold shock and DUF1294 domain-containing protein [Alysiella crassa]UOP06391.1 cold shock and DUF1294 domain-containing protein [Alysiella crassa]SSY80910.1 Protein of uncharacterised function (DUF1294) [Alysiella crassa]
MTQLFKPAPDYDTKILLHRGVAGNIVKWNAERGFGFIKTAALEEEIFFHANNLVAKQQRAPRKNEAITVYAKYDETQKCWTATQVTSAERAEIADAYLAQEQALLRPMKDKLMWAVPLVCVWLILLMILAWQLAAISALVSGVAMILYAWDKHCALHARSRVPENSLHAVALLGGWAGALVARYLFRHKTQKQPFVGIFWGTVVLNVVLVGYLIFSGSLK